MQYAIIRAIVNDRIYGLYTINTFFLLREKGLIIA